jgi:dihydrofolate reductase
VRTSDVAEVARVLEAHGKEGEKQNEAERSYRVYVDGGELVRSFIRVGLLNEIAITMIPKLIGEGRRLFDRTQDVELVLKECKYWEFGFVQVRYDLKY